MTPVLGNPGAAADLVDWGPEGESEAGVWRCTPGDWRCHVSRDEFRHFLEGRCATTHDSGAHEPGETIEIEPDTAAIVAVGLTGTCRVHATVRKAYMIGRPANKGNKGV